MALYVSSLGGERKLVSLPTATKQNHSTSAPAYASLAESTETVVRQSFVLFGFANVGSKKREKEMCCGSPICPI